MKAASSTKLAIHKGKYFCRSIGRWKNSNGKIDEKKFLLGADRKLAEIANLRLEKLWDEVKTATAEENEERHRHSNHDIQIVGLTGPVDRTSAFWATAAAEAVAAERPPAPREPLWTEESLMVAEAIRKGETVLVVPPRPGPAGVKRYAEEIARLQRRYSGMTFVASDQTAIQNALNVHAKMAHFYMDAHVEEATSARIPIATATGRTLHEALDRYSKWALENKKRQGETTKWGRILSEQVLRLKNSHTDIPLDRFDFNAVERIKGYWASRPNGKNTGEPIAIDTVRCQLNALRMFVKWLHRNPDFTWRKPDDVDEAWKCDLGSLLNDTEVAALKDGVATFTVDQLTTLYQYATDRERVFMLLGLNCGFARTECVMLNQSEIDRSTDPPRIKRIRGKTRVYGEWALWPETVAALDWIERECPCRGNDGSATVIRSERGFAMKDTDVANYWNDLLRRVVSECPDFRPLPIKFLRKTATQMVRNAADGETAGVFLAHGNPVEADPLAGVYSNPVFARVFAALDKVRQVLKPMFESAPDAFSRPRKRGGPNLGRKVIQRIEQLRRDGHTPGQIAKLTGVSRSTAYRRTVNSVPAVLAMT